MDLCDWKFMYRLIIHLPLHILIKQIYNLYISVLRKCDNRQLCQIQQPVLCAFMQYILTGNIRIRYVAAFTDLI